MYETHFGLRTRPFRTTLDTTRYYPAGAHERTLTRILQGVNDQESMLLLTAEPGVGKTLLGHVLLERLGGNTAAAFLTNGHIPSRLALLQAALFELSAPYEGLGEQEARLALTELLLKTYAAGRKTLLLVDEAQHLSADLLEELRMLGNLEAAGGKALQVLLIAQPAIAAILQLPQLGAIRQRLVIRARLDPLSIEESADFLRHQLRLAGGRPEVVIADEAVVLLAQACRGIPRLLNQAAHQALLLAFEASAPQTDVEAALEALNALGLDAGDELPSVASPLSTAAAYGDDSGPLLSLADTVADPVLLSTGELPTNNFDADPGDVDNYERMVSPKRPA
jgi:type II secretory pathway predicted ATPase ExeA